MTRYPNYASSKFAGRYLFTSTLDLGDRTWQEFCESEFSKSVECQCENRGEGAVNPISDVRCVRIKGHEGAHIFRLGPT
jgi:hypothetical protein